MIQTLIEKALLKAFLKLWPIIVDKAMALLPVLITAIIDGVTKSIKFPDVAQLPQAAKALLDKAIDADPDLPGISNVFDLTENLKAAADKLFGGLK